MYTSLVESKVTGLDTFAAWQMANAEQQRAFNAVPFNIDQQDAQQLRQQLAYLACEEEQRAARQTLMQEVASQDDRFLPVSYKLGILAAFEATDLPLKTKRHRNGWTSIGDDVFQIDTREQQIRPSPNPLKLAIQVGDEIERIVKILDSRRAIPVAMVWNHRFIPPRIDYDEVVIGELPDPRGAFRIESPKVIEVNGEKVVDYTIPSRLFGVVVGDVIEGGEHMRLKDKYKNPAITTLARLGIFKDGSIHHAPDALYIGKKEVKKRVAKAKQDKAANARQLELARMSR